MLRFFKQSDKTLFRWCGVIQQSVIKPLYSKGEFTQNDIKSLIQFCFPIDQPISGPLFFVFRFRPSNGNFYNVFCLLDQTSFQLKDMDTNQQCVICIITEYFHANVFEEILKAIRSLLLHSISTTERFLEAIIKSPTSINTVPYLSDLYTYNITADTNLKSIVKVAFDFMNPQQIGRLVIALLTDTPIIVISSDLSKLSSFCYALIGLIYPLTWHHIFAPVLPLDFIDSVSSPAPFIVGLHRDIIQKAMNCDIEGHLLVDIDDQNVSESGLPPISPYAGQLMSRLHSNSVIELRIFIVSLVCTCLGIQAANTRATTVKRINEALKSTKFDTNSFACSLLQSRTMRSFFDAIRERTVPQEYAKMIALASTSSVTSLAIQCVDEFPLRRKGQRSGVVQRSMSLQFTSGEKIPPSVSLPTMTKNLQTDSDSQNTSS
ncbi:hypothetical protein TRFO_07847 [Tritrichomonas foetus]|uniref:UDENN domain-containing protein n=1 Tax=Tritrichomonas foetus TaxID=1144522 RepID=A0A1J4JQ41_9EUKA|nr:hypothetical protein TRFO_07847 [Tritrichomonas foetus]|eukprot:OHT00536.1 hypothetical protein TRFO_07847 [Tritrichomonas foetus]